VDNYIIILICLTSNIKKDTCRFILVLNMYVKKWHVSKIALSYGCKYYHVKLKKNIWWHYLIHNHMIKREHVTHFDFSCNIYELYDILKRINSDQFIDKNTIKKRTNVSHFDYYDVILWLISCFVLLIFGNWFFVQNKIYIITCFFCFFLWVSFMGQQLLWVSFYGFALWVTNVVQS
jgi:hypothetical protein